VLLGPPGNVKTVDFADFFAKYTEFASLDALLQQDGPSFPVFSLLITHIRYRN
jgi:hypothetical protein